MIFDNERKRIIIDDVHEGPEEHPKVKVSAAHGRECKGVYQKLPRLSTARKKFL